MKSSSDSFSITKYDPQEGGEVISAKIAQSASISGGADLTLETGAYLEIVDSAVLTAKNGSTITINTDGVTKFEVGENSGLVMEDGAVLEINIEETARNAEAYTFSVINWQENSIIEGLDSLIKGETLLLSVNGEAFSGIWDYILSDNQLTVSMQVPEPAVYAAVFGALALAYAACRRRK